MKINYTFLIVLISFMNVSAQHALTYHKSYKGTTFFDFQGWEDGVSYHYPFNQKFGMNVGVMTAFLKKDLIRDDIMNTPNYYTLDDFRQNFPNFTPISYQPSTNFSKIYSSFRKDYGFSIQLLYKNKISKKVNFHLSSGYNYQVSNGQLLIGVYDLAIVTPPLSIFSGNFNKLPIKYPAHIFFGYIDNQFSNQIGLNIFFSRRLSLGISSDIRISMQKAGIDYLLGTNLKYSIIK